MPDVELVIKIQEEDYNNIGPFLNGQTIKGGLNLFKVLEIINSGTPLPKGHGKLIDAGKLEECKEIMNTISGKGKYAVRMDAIRNMPTIIEADTTETNGFLKSIPVETSDN